MESLPNDMRQRRKQAGAGERRCKENGRKSWPAPESETRCLSPFWRCVFDCVCPLQTSQLAGRPAHQYHRALSRFFQRNALQNKTYECKHEHTRTHENRGGEKGEESQTTLIQESSAAAAGAIELDEDEELEEPPPSDASASLSCLSTTAFSEGEQSRQRKLKACSSGTLWP